MVRKFIEEELDSTNNIILKKLEESKFQNNELGKIARPIFLVMLRNVIPNIKINSNNVDPYVRLASFCDRMKKLFHGNREVIESTDLLMGKVEKLSPLGVKAAFINLALDIFPEVFNKSGIIVIKNSIGEYLRAA